jgi:hypothetical protein
MSHVNLQGNAVVFGECVSDELYGQAPEITEEKESR